MANTSTPNKLGKRLNNVGQTRPPKNNRVRYEQEAEALITLCELEYGPYFEGADIGDRRKRPLSKGIYKHMLQIFEHADFLNPYTIRMFYVELRLWGDELAALEAQESLLVQDERVSE